MKRTRLLAFLAVFALVVAACSPSTEEGTETTAGSGEGTTTTAASPGTTQAPTGAEAGSGGELLILQWQAPSVANGLLSSGTKDFLASSLVLEPLLEVAPDATLVSKATPEEP